MAKIGEIDETMWAEWLATRPAIVQALAARLRPDTLYRLRGSGHRCTLYSYNENGTVTVTVDGRFNRVLFGRNVFGISPEDLEECDLPTTGEDVGDLAEEAGYSERDVEEILIPRLREVFRMRQETSGHPEPDA